MGIFAPGGAQLSALRLSTALRARGIESRFYAGDLTAEGAALAREHGFEVEGFGEELGLQWEPSRDFAAWLAPRLRGADLVHAHMFGAWWAAAQVMATEQPLVASEHNVLTWPGNHHAREMRAALGRVDLMFAHGPAARAYLRALGCPPERLLHGESAIAGTDAVPLPGLPRPRVVQTARLSPDKGADLLVEALARMEDPPPAFILGEGPLRPGLEARIRELGLEAVVRFPGWQREPARWVAGASVLAVPSREEAWSQSAVTAMGLGVPVVGFAVEALPEVLGGGRGILVAPGDPEALAAALADVLAGRRRPDLEAARRYAARFTPERVAARYAERYEALTCGAGARWTTFVAITSSSSSGP